MSNSNDEPDTSRECELDEPLNVVRTRCQQSPILVSLDHNTIFLGDIYAGATAFLACSGPSLAEVDKDSLSQAGILNCSVNNAATVVRSNIWVSFDHPGNFSDVIWRDPTILKLVPVFRLNKPIRLRNETGELVESSELAGNMPNTLGYRNNGRFVAKNWLFEDSVNCGNSSGEVDSQGLAGSRSVMLVAIKLLFYLGIRRIFLLGCDFRMSYGTKNYAFEQHRTRASVRGNNRTYRVLNSRFTELVPYFEQANFKVYNCTPNSGLTAFPHVEFDRAIEMALETMPNTVDTSGMYEMDWRKKKNDDSNDLSK